MPQRNVNETYGRATPPVDSSPTTESTNTSPLPFSGNHFNIIYTSFGHGFHTYVDCLLRDKNSEGTLLRYDVTLMPNEETKSSLVSPLFKNKGFDKLSYYKQDSLGVILLFH